MNLSVQYSASGATIYAFVKRLGDGLYYRVATEDFGAFVEANCRSLLTEDANLSGLYSVAIDLNSNWTDGGYVVVYYVGSVDPTHVIDSEHLGVINQTVCDLSTLHADVLRTLGLSKENMYMDNTVYTEGKITSARIRTYSTYPFTPGSDTPLATYQLTVAYTGGQMNSWKMERQ